MTHHPRKRQQGFTLLELVMVIVILGLIAAVALPRFYDLEADARSAKVDGIIETLRTVSASLHASAQAKGLVHASGDTLATEEGAVDLVYGYPAGSAAGIVRAARLDAERDKVSINAGTTPGTVVIDIHGGAPGSCTVTFTQAGAAHRPPTIAANKSAC